MFKQKLLLLATITIFASCGVSEEEIKAIKEKQVADSLVQDSLNKAFEAELAKADSVVEAAKSK